MSVNTGGAEQVEIERLTVKVEELKNELAACRSEQEIGYDDAREMQAKVEELKAALTRLADDEPFRDTEERIEFARAALEEKT